MNEAQTAFVEKATEIVEQVTDEDPDQIGLNALIAVLTRMAEGVLIAGEMAIAGDDVRQIDRLSGQSEVLVTVLSILNNVRDGRDAAELAVDLVDELEQILGDAV